MTVTNSTSSVQYAGNGVTVAFSFSSGGTPIPFFAKSDIVVSLFDTVANLAVTPAPVMGGGATYDYTVTAAADPATGEFISGATVTFNTAPLATYLVTLTRAVPQTQGVALTDGSSFSAKVVEAALDRLTMIAQQIQTLLLRTLRQPTEDVAAIGALPNKGARSGKLLAFDAVTGDPMPSNLTLAVIEASGTSAAAAAASATSAAASAGTASTASTAAVAAQAAAESAAAGMKWRPSVRVATTANIVLSGTQTIDAIAVVAGDRVLVKDQATPKDNGVYVCAAGAWTRALDADTWVELVSQVVAVEVGTVNADFTFICTSDQGGTIGVTSVTWSSFKIIIPDASLTSAKLTATGVGAASYTNANITVDAQGRVTAAASGVASSSGRKWLDTQVAAASAALTFVSDISATYKKYELSLVGIILSAASADLLLEVSTDNGATWKTTTYLNNEVTLSSGGPTYTASTIGIMLAPVATAQTIPISGEVEFGDPNSTTEVCWFGGRVNLFLAGTTPVAGMPAGFYNVTGTAINAVRVRPSTGTITRGEATLSAWQRA